MHFPHLVALSLLSVFFKLNVVLLKSWQILYYTEWREITGSSLECDGSRVAPLCEAQGRTAGRNTSGCHQVP